MNGIQGEKASVLQCNILLNAVVAVLKYKKITIDHDIYIKFLSDVKLSYIKVSTDDSLNTTNTETLFPELRIVFEGSFDINVQELSVFEYLNFRTCQPNIGLSVYQTDRIMGLVN